MIRLLSYMFLFVVLLSTSVKAEEIIAKGTLQGADGHDAGGSVQFVKLDNGSTEIRFSGDFFIESVPDAYLGFGNPKYDEASNFKKLRQLKGEQKHILPKEIDLASYSHFYIWCRSYSVAIGVAKLEK